MWHAVTAPQTLLNRPLQHSQWLAFSTSSTREQGFPRFPVVPGRVPPSPSLFLFYCHHRLLPKFFAPQISSLSYLVSSIFSFPTLRSSLLSCHPLSISLSLQPPLPTHLFFSFLLYYLVTTLPHCILRYHNPVGTSCAPCVTVANPAQQPKTTPNNWQTPYTTLHCNFRRSIHSAAKHPSRPRQPKLCSSALSTVLTHQANLEPQPIYTQACLPPDPIYNQIRL